MSQPQPKRGEVRNWMLGILASACGGLFLALIEVYFQHGKDLKQKDQDIKELRIELTKCQDEKTASERAFREEKSMLYQEVQEFREEIYRSSLRQQKALKK